VPDIPARSLPECGALALAAIGTDAWIFSLQGFSYEDRLSRFAAPFAGDHWRHTAIIGGLLRGSEAVFLPDEGRFLRIQLIGVGYFVASEVVVRGTPERPNK